MNILKSIFRVIWIICKVLFKFLCFMSVMLFGAYLLAPLGKINSKGIDLSTFTNTPNDAMMVVFNSEYFSGYLFSVTIALVIFVVYLLWELHEVAVHKAQEKNSTHIQLVFALSLCGLFIHKAWWVLAIIIAFANWKHIGTSLTDIIKNGLAAKRENTAVNDTDSLINQNVKTQ